MPATHCTRCQRPLDVLDVVNDHTVCARCLTVDTGRPAGGLRGFLARKKERPAPSPEPAPALAPPPQPPRRARRRRAPRSVRIAASVTLAILFAALHVWIYYTFTSASRPREGRPAQSAGRKALDAALAYQATHPKDTDGAIRRFEALRAEHPGSPTAEQAAREIERLRERTSQGEPR